MEALDLELLRVVRLDEVCVGKAFLGDRADRAAAPRFSREACLIRRENRLELRKKSGRTVSDTRASSQLR